MTHASGTFEVRFTPQTSDGSADLIVRRLSIEKQFHGDLEATSRGAMLTISTTVTGSAGYVAIEQVSGTLIGRTGAFVLQHNGIMDRGTPHLTIALVPDSGTGELAGLTGTMTIKITDGKHFYEFEYELPESH